MLRAAVALGFSRDPSTRNKMHYNCDDSQNYKDMDKTPCDMEGEKTQRPQNEKHYRDSYPHFLDGLASSSHSFL